MLEDERSKDEGVCGRLKDLLLRKQAVRYFESPVIEDSVVFGEVALLRVAVEQQLKSKSRLPCTISFRGDVYRLLLQSRGTFQDGWHLLQETDFPARYFPKFWDHLADSHGQGIKVRYPMKVRHFISWSPKKYSVEGDHHPSPRAFQEKFTFSFVKVALGDNS